MTAVVHSYVLLHNQSSSSRLEKERKKGKNVKGKGLGIELP
jgi:hypothetical protein